MTTMIQDGKIIITAETNEVSKMALALADAATNEGRKGRLATSMVYQELNRVLADVMFESGGWKPEWKNL